MSKSRQVTDQMLCAELAKILSVAYKLVFLWPHSAC